MIQSSALLKDLKAQLKLVQADLRARADDTTDRWGARLQEEYTEARKRERTGHSWVVWRDNEVDQAAVAWLIATTFVRFCEDNDLLGGARIDGQPVSVGWIAGPGDRTARAEENLTAYFRHNPTHNRRDWLREAIRVLAAQPAGAALVDEKHNPVWIADISAECASGLVDFWRATNAAGELVHDFNDASLDTRFLGDLYQDLSEHARKTYALLQTPVFVEEFILDQTLMPALAEFGLDGIKLIDPTCGSGHFLLGAFERLVDQWQTEAPALDAKERVRRAMGSIHGVDLNPFAVAIARFRLTVAGLLAMGERSLVGVPNLGFHLAIGDSLLGEFGGAPEALQFEGEEAETYFYDGEDLKEYAGILKPGQYHVVVGNPPYITVKDKALNALYRLSYKTAAGKYALSAPFMELFFRLAIKGEQGQGAGIVGQITSNSFMKREFGKKLIEYLFAGHDLGNPVDLTEVIDTSGAYIPGHGTPTVILCGRRRRPVKGVVHVVLGLRGEPGKPADPAQGQVWKEIAGHSAEVGYEGEFISVVEIARETLTNHPWSLGSDVEATLKARIEGAASSTVSEAVRVVGIMGMTNADDAFLAPREAFLRRGVEVDAVRRLVTGESVRDFRLSEGDDAFFPYLHDRLVDAHQWQGAYRWLWPSRTETWNRSTFAKISYRAEGRAWWEWHQISLDRIDGPVITFAFVATHNHFYFDRGGKVFNRTAQVIKLRDGATEDDHLGMTALLNSSTACFWLHKMCLGKPLQGEEWQRRYEFDSTKVSQFPLVDARPVLQHGRTIDHLAAELARHEPAAVIRRWLDAEARGQLRDSLDGARSEWSRLLGELIFAQEELDWATYALYGISDRALVHEAGTAKSISLGQRAFEMSLARDVESGADSTTWFEKHGSTPTTVFPLDWPEQYRQLVAARLEAIAADPAIRLLENPEFKRRWTTPAWDAQAPSAIRHAILNFTDDPGLWRDAQGPVARSVSELADALRSDEVIRELVTVLTGNAEADLAKVLDPLVTEDAVPYLAAHRYKPAGLEKFRTWQQTWDLQRREDAGEKVDIPVPPKYSTPDFRKAEYWKARGKLDVPKERFILYPHLGREGDATVVLGWAGWDHKDQALALAREFPVQDALGAGDELLTQMVAGLVELEPWVHQWHSEMDVSFGVSPADAISGVIDQQLGRLEATREEATAWEPPAQTRGRRAKNS